MVINFWISHSVLYSQPNCPDTKYEIWKNVIIRMSHKYGYVIKFNI